MLMTILSITRTTTIDPDESDWAYSEYMEIVDNAIMFNTIAYYISCCIK